ncbi:hypothetical protein MMC25_002314 [Agyrium rufum]|nr:hypothetical protein [Agyrium rufum]
MSVSGLFTPTRTDTIEADQYDHAINLVDATAPPDIPSQPPTPLDSPSDLDSSAKRDLGASPGKKLPKDGVQGGLREELARRRYAKWQEKRYSGGRLENDGDPTNMEAGTAEEGSGVADPKKAASKRDWLRDKARLRSKRSAKVSKCEECEYDILYENQRGSFIFGFPLYSAKGLLNFDPAAWQTSAFKESPVNIMTAQVPDPSWTWAWKRWYVDMSHDVDEQGWEYSFSFRHGFSWHGTHPWFHSYVRRRRWLRKRVKVHGASSRKNEASKGHMLNPDYFTIHAKKVPSRESSTERTIDNRSSHMSGRLTEADSDEDDEEDITNVLSLMKALKRTTIDRKKLGSVENFLLHGDEDLHYLPEYMDEIMSMFMYQTSRRQFLDLLRNLCEEPADDHEASTTEDDVADENVKSHSQLQHDAIHQAMLAAEEHMQDLEYWSDRQKMASMEKGKEVEGRTLDGVNEKDLHDGQSSIDGGEDQLEVEAPPSMRSQVSIRGIPSDAGIDEEPGLVMRANTLEDGEKEANGSNGPDERAEEDTHPSATEAITTTHQEVHSSSEGEKEPGKIGED